ncbi:MAG: transcriptional regulator FtrA [Alphaproteobacteria bacterium]|nr:transcriptional regulator FtrA [Alphaproteobacteria bacterium]
MPDSSNRPGPVALIAYRGLCAFEYGIAAELFLLKRPELGVPWYRVRIVAGEPGPLTGSGGVRVQADAGLDALARARLIVMPGWRDTAERPPEPLLAALRAAARRGARFFSICGGAFVLGHAGLLDGRRATTHWMQVDRLRAAFPTCRVEADALYVEDGGIVTSAGSAAGIDAGLHVIRVDYGAEIANKVARRLVMSPHREGGQAQFVEAPVSLRPGQSVGPALDWARARLHRPVSVAGLAAAAGMSRRTFLRRFEEALGAPPRRWLEGERIARARGLLESTPLALADVARQCGYRSPETFRVAFRRVVGTGPAAWRDRFTRN